MPKPRRSPVSKAAIPAPLPPATNPLNIGSVYVNNVQLASANIFDVRILFNEVVIEEGKRVTVERRANIVMSVSEFMALVQLLNANVPVIQKSIQMQAEAMQKAQMAEFAALGMPLQPPAIEK